MRSAILLIILAVSCFGITQQSAAPEKKNSKPKAANAESQKPDPARERALQLLETAEAGSRSLDPISHAYTLIQVARAYQSTDKKKALELLEEAITTAQLAVDANRGESYHATEIKKAAFKIMITFDPARADELVTGLDPDDREDVLDALLPYYEREKKLDRAIEQINDAAGRGEALYGFASRVMDALPSEQQDLKTELFTLCLSSFSDHSHVQPSYGERDFGEMVLRFNKDLAAPLVEQAIDVLLKDAQEIDKNNGDSAELHVSLASEGGAVQIGSAYEYRLFQLLPLLRSLDPDKAERILKGEAGIQPLLQKYPQGLAALNGNGQKMSYGFSNAAGFGGSGALSGGGAPVEAQKAAAFLRDAENHPQDALDNILALSNVSIKTSTLIKLGESTWKKNPTVAKQALRKAMDSAEELRSGQAILDFDQIGRTFLRMEDKDDASTLVERGIKLSERVYKDDTNPDDPNRAPKVYWPSTAGWRRMLAMASKISPLWAAELLKEIRDEECRTLAQLDIAASLLKADPSEVQIDNWRKEVSVSFYQTYH